MLDRTEAESLLYRVASAALGYYPDKPAREPGYVIEEDIDWCLKPLSRLPRRYHDTLRTRIREVVEDPTAHRYEFTRDVMALVSR
tara:strand:+ start:13613 stop:13867 length:255 start_codon:yes stop_codon:yes gene_type:complete